MQDIGNRSVSNLNNISIVERVFQDRKLRFGFLKGVRNYVLGLGKPRISKF